MTFEEIRAAVEVHVAAWTGAPIAFDGVPLSQDVIDAQEARNPWVRLTIQHGDSFTAGIGANPCVRRTGLIMVQIFTARDVGSRSAMLLADSLAQHLEYYRSGELETLAASVNRVGPSEGYYQVNLTVPFRAG
tara:strand:- start:423 stop:821 length:399 start_codon:yes stop_codon:yes gene_type:complete